MNRFKLLARVTSVIFEVLVYISRNTLHHTEFLSHKDSRADIILLRENDLCELSQVRNNLYLCLFVTESSQ